MNYPYQKVLDSWHDLAQHWSSVRGNLSAIEILATITEESGGNPVAINPSDPSWGLMGVSLYIGKKYAGISIGSSLFDPNINIDAGSGFLSYLKETYGSRHTLGSADGGWIQMYNMGEPAFQSGKRVPGYEQAYMGHIAAFQAMMGGQK